MSKPRKIVVCIDDLKTFVKKYENNSFFKDEIKNHDVTLLHIFEKTFYNDEFSEYSWPPEEKHKEIEDKVNIRLIEIAKSFTDIIHTMNTRCLISDDARESVTHFLEDQKADLAIVFARGLSQLEGLFLSSMTEHLVRTTSCPILVMRE